MKDRQVSNSDGDCIMTSIQETHDASGNVESEYP